MNNRQGLFFPQNSLDFLRLCFAAITAVSHFLYLSGIPAYVKFTPFFDTKVAVMGFFVISGLLISNSYLRSKSLKDYAIKRCKRLLPAYIGVVAGCAVVLSLVSNLPFEAYFSHPAWYKYVGFNLVFLNFIQPTLPGVFTGNMANGAVNGSLWTLKIEVMFYISIPVLIYIMNRLQTQRNKNLFLLSLYCAAIAYVYVLDYIYAANHNLLVSTLSHQFPAHLQYFSTGMFMFYNFDWVYKHANRLILPGILIFLERYLLGTTYIWPLGLGIIIFYIGFRLPQLKRITRGNDYSYGLYIIHFPIAQLLISQGILQLPFFIAFILYFLIISALAILSWHFIEKPVLRR